MINFPVKELYVFGVCLKENALEKMEKVEKGRHKFVAIYFLMI